MVKYFALALALVGSVAMADLAEARSRRGGCPGGACNASFAPAKMAATDNAPPAVAADPEASSAAPAAAAAQPASRFFGNSARRNVLAWRR